MFRKQFKVKSNTKTKSSERKAFIQKVSNLFGLQNDDATSYFAKKDLFKIKICLHNQSDAFIYNFENQPLFIEHNSQIIPTVYFLWNFPDIFPCLTTHSPVISKLQNGADLMLPGVTIEGQPNLSSYGSLQKGQLCAINTTTNKCPVAVGHANISSYDMFMSARQGKALVTFHVIGDMIWQMGDQSSPPRIEWPHPDRQVVSDDDDDDSESDESQGAAGESADVPAGDSGPSDDTFQLEQDVQQLAMKDPSDDKREEMTPDDYLLQCFLHALKYSAKDKLLPMPTNIFYAKHLLKYCYEDKPLEIKKTSFKKVGAFMREMENRGLVKLNDTNGVQTLISVSREHNIWHGFRSFLKDNAIEAPTEDSSSANVTYRGPPTIEDVWFILDKVLPLFRSMGRKKNDCLTANEIRQLVTQYIKENDLQSPNDKSMVILDPILSDAVCNKNDSNKTELKWKDVIDKLCKNMTKGSRINFPNENPIHTKTKVPLIKIQMFTSGNKKKVTKLSNLESFRINATEFCKLVQHGRACSCGVMNDMVQAQGDQRQYMEKLLIESYKLPRRFVQVIDDKPGK